MKCFGRAGEESWGGLTMGRRQLKRNMSTHGDIPSLPAGWEWGYTWSCSPRICRLPQWSPGACSSPVLCQFSPEGFVLALWTFLPSLQPGETRRTCSCVCICGSRRKGYSCPSLPSSFLGKTFASNRLPILVKTNCLLFPVS